jgi:hypothetical protein
MSASAPSWTRAPRTTGCGRTTTTAGTSRRSPCSPPRPATAAVRPLALRVLRRFTTGSWSGRRRAAPGSCLPRGRLGSRPQGVVVLAGEPARRLAPSGAPRGARQGLVPGHRGRRPGRGAADPGPPGRPVRRRLGRRRRPVPGRGDAALGHPRWAAPRHALLRRPDREVRAGRREHVDNPAGGGRAVAAAPRPRRGAGVPLVNDPDLYNGARARSARCCRCRTRSTC